MTNQEEVFKGHEAQLLIDNPLFKGAVEAVRKGIISALSSSAMGDETTHNRLTIALQLLAQIEKQIITHIETGKMAELQIKQTLGQKVMSVVKR